MPDNESDRDPSVVQRYSIILVCWICFFSISSSQHDLSGFVRIQGTGDGAARDADQEIEFRHLQFGP